METSQPLSLSPRRQIWVLPSWFPTRVYPANGDFIQRWTVLMSHEADIRVFCAWRDPETKVDSCDRRVSDSQLITYTYTLRRSRGPWGYFLDRKREWRYFMQCVDRERSAGFEADIIIGHVGFPKSWLFLKSKRYLQKPLILCEHWSAYARYETLPNWIRSALWRVCRRADAVVAVSQSLKDRMTEAIGRADIRVIPNPVTVPPLIPKTSETSIPTWIHISAFMTPVKNVYSMLEGISKALKSGAQFRVVLLGDEPDAELLNAIDMLGLSKTITIMPPCSHEQTLSHLQQSDALLHFSLYETFSIVVAEALAMGKPVLCSRCGGVCSLIDGPLGRSVEPDDTDAFADAMVDMSSHLNQYHPKTINQYAQTHFADKKVIKEWLKLMEEQL